MDVHKTITCICPVMDADASLHALPHWHGLHMDIPRQTWVKSGKLKSDPGDLCNCTLISMSTRELCNKLPGAS